MANPLPHCVSGEIPQGALLDEEVGRIIQETAAEIADRFPIEMEAIGTDKNHIHVLWSAHPKMAPGRIVQIFKSITAREIFRRKPAVKRVLWGGELWIDGYSVATVGEWVNWQTVERYVQRQGQPREDLRQLRMFKFCDTPQLAAGSFISEQFRTDYSRLLHHAELEPRT